MREGRLPRCLVRAGNQTFEADDFKLAVQLARDLPDSYNGPVEIEDRFARMKRFVKDGDRIHQKPIA